jgi:hypothetical protein
MHQEDADNLDLNASPEDGPSIKWSEWLRDEYLQDALGTSNAYLSGSLA